MAAVAPPPAPPAALAAPAAGGSFLIGSPDSTFTPEDFTEEHRQIAATATRFMDEEVIPAIGEYEQKKDGIARGLVEKAGELGLLSILAPEKFGGLELDVTSQMLVADTIGRYAAFSVTYGAQCGIGMLPLVFFGNDEQKGRYLERIMSGELIAAYCLSEPQAGSDALAARTRADLSDDGTHYTLNGQKMWISNGGWADLYTVFAQVDGDKFTGFLVERSAEGVKPGAEEHKMGIRGSSTTAVFLDNVKVPVQNLLGEVGRGHIIAFNILNLGRLKLGSSSVGSSKHVIAESASYAKQRKAFGKAIAEFGAIQHKLAEMAIRTYVGESIVYRTCGLIDSRLSGLSWDSPDAAGKHLKGVEEYAVECAITKVVATEGLDYVADEGVQIHGGYGFHEDYHVERAYRDARINRIFEGTSEINRLLTTGMLLKRALQGRLDLMSAIQRLLAQLQAGELGAESGQGPLADEAALLACAKKVALLGMGIAYERFGQALDEEQEVNSALADIIMLVYSLESVLLRAQKLLAAGKGVNAAAMTRVFARDALTDIARHGSTIVAACTDGAKLEQSFGLLRRLTRFVPMNLIAVRREIAGRIIDAEKYVV